MKISNIQWKRVGVILLSLFLLNPAYAITIIQKPIIFDNTRIKLTQQYQRKHYGIYSKSIEIEPKIIVLHWTETKTLQQAFNEFNSPIAHRRDIPDKLNVSAHYLVDRDGTIYQLMPDHWMARHVIGLNHYAIGIENVGGVNDHPDLTNAQVKANRELIRYLKQEYPSIKYIIGHKDYLKFKGTSLWLEKNDHYVHVKFDPDEGFMRRVKSTLQ